MCGGALNWWNVMDTRTFGVRGVANVRNGFEAPLHKHAATEIYLFTKGIGLLYLDGGISVVHSNTAVVICPNVWHAMTPITERVLLRYSFPFDGAFDKIEYTYDRLLLYQLAQVKLRRLVTRAAAARAHARLFAQPKAKM